MDAAAGPPSDRDYDELLSELEGDVVALDASVKAVTLGKEQLAAAKAGGTGLSHESKATLKAGALSAKALSAKLSALPHATKRDLLGFIQAKESQRIIKLMRMAQAVDLCFVLDATGSMDMGAILAATRQQIRNLVTEVRRHLRHLQIRLALVVYRDLEDAQPFEVSPFSSSISVFEAVIGAVVAGGGGDQCEDVVGGLDQARRLEWRSPTRVLVLCGDAPCHGAEYHDGCLDDHPGGTGMAPAPILQALRKQGVDMTFMRVNASTDKMIEAFDRHAGGQYISTAPLSKADLADSIKKTVLKSVTYSVSATGHGPSPVFLRVM